MTKKIASYYLSESVRSEIVKLAREDNRNPSPWLDLYLTKQFKKKDEKPKLNRFRRPNQQEIGDFANENNLTASGFFDYYESNGWKAGKNSMKDWKAALRGWSKRQSSFTQRTTSSIINQSNFGDDEI